jgi:hypothetical protein
MIYGRSSENDKLLGNISEIEVLVSTPETSSIMPLE